MSRPDRLTDRLLSVGYHARREEALAVEGALRALGAGRVAALLCEGPAGCGKTCLAEALAELLGGGYIYHLLHSWSDDQELLVGVDVAAAVAGDAEHVRQPGVLARAAELSQTATREAPAVLCLDEIDKVQEGTANLLLDFLQTGRVPVRPGEHLATDLSSLLVIITSNATRPLPDALLRRVRRVRMRALPVKIQDQIVLERTGSAPGVVRLACRAARRVAQGEGTQLSLQELVAFVEELECSESVRDVRLSLAGWAARTDRGAEAAGRCDLCAAVRSEIRQARRADGE